MTEEKQTMYLKLCSWVAVCDVSDHTWCRCLWQIIHTAGVCDTDHTWCMCLWYKLHTAYTTYMEFMLGVHEYCK